jgi:putative spermidine/putrescine transport system substrate-binding protein
MSDFKKVDRLLEEYYTGAISRRQFIRRALLMGLSAAALPGMITSFAAEPARAQAITGTGEVVVCSWGGAYTEAQRKAFFDPFERQTGIRVRTVGVPDLAKIRAMVQTKNVEWDLIDAEGRWVQALGEQGMLERADYNIIPKDEHSPGAISDYGIGSVAYGYVMGWNTQKFPAGRSPSTWQHWFNAQQYPGRRAMYSDPMPILEFALMGDGVPMEQVYQNNQMDVDRAFRFLQSRKSMVNVWYRATTQAETLMRGGEVDIIHSPNGRMINLKRDNQPVDFTYNQGAWMQSFWVTPKGSRNKENAWKLGAYLARAVNQAQFAVYYAGMGMGNVKAYSYMPKEIIDFAITSPANLKVTLRISIPFWAKNTDDIQKRWLAFLG